MSYFAYIIQVKVAVK